MINRCLRERGDASIKTNADLIARATFYDDPNFPSRRAAREHAERATVLDTSARMHTRFELQTLLMHCMAEQRLDALVHRCPLCRHESRCATRRRALRFRIAAA